MKTTLHTLLAAGLLFGMSAASHAAILLEIDITNPDRIYFTPTTNAPYVNSTWNSNIGFILLDFLTQDRYDYKIHTECDLRTSTGMALGDDFDTISFYKHDFPWGTIAGKDANLQNQWSPGPNTQIFQTNMPAFIGRATNTVLGYMIPLFHQPGYTNTILVGNFQNQGPIIGEYKIVPEASAYALFTLGTLVVVNGLVLRGYLARRRGLG